MKGQIHHTSKAIKRSSFRHSVVAQTGSSRPSGRLSMSPPGQSPRYHREQHPASVDVLWVAIWSEDKNVMKHWELLGSDAGIQLTEPGKGGIRQSDLPRVQRRKGYINGIKDLDSTGYPATSQPANSALIDMIRRLTSGYIEVVRGTMTPVMGCTILDGNQFVNARVGKLTPDGRLTYSAASIPAQVQNLRGA